MNQRGTEIMHSVDKAHPRVYDQSTSVASRDWRSYVPDGVRPYIEPAPLAAFCLGISSGAGFAMIGATLTTRLSQYGIAKSARSEERRVGKECRSRWWP